MQVGDLVKINSMREHLLELSWDMKIGTVVKVHHWVDQGAPDRNFGTDIHVLWQSGNVEAHTEDELEVVSYIEDR